MRRRLVLTLAAAGALAAIPAAASAVDAAPPTILARVVPGADPADIAADNGLTLERVIPRINWIELGVPAGSPEAAGRSLLRDGRVFRYDHAGRGEGWKPDLIPADPLTQTPLNLINNPGFTTNYHWVATNFFSAWDQARSSANTRVAVIDSEFDTEHPDLKTKFATGFNAIHGSTEYHTGNVRATATQINEVLNDPAGGTHSLHGTHVSGLVAAATENGIGVSGAGFNSVIVPIKIAFDFFPGQTVGTQYSADAAEAIRWAADNGRVRIISMSFGGTRDYPVIRDAVAYAASKDILLVASAGNDQENPLGTGVTHYPAAYPNVLAVAATDPNSLITRFSSNGDYVDVSAPGDQILSTWDTRVPGIIANGQNVPGYRFLSGTSMATPIVSGLAALIRDRRPDLTAAETEAIITSTASDVGAGGRDPIFGAGIINADAAVKAAIAYVRPGPPPDTRSPVRFFWSCEAGSKTIAAGKRPFVGVVRNVKLECKGRTAPAIRKTRIEIQRFAARRGFIRIGTVRTNNKGRFGFTRRITTLGNWRLRVAFGGSATLLPSGSLAVKVKAVPRRR